MARDLTGGSTDGQSPFSAAPRGLQQQGSARDLTGGQGQSPWLRPGWQTGGQTGSTRNSFNDEFYTRMYDQYDEEQKKIQADKGYVSNLFLREDFTGIVGWDQKFKKDDPVFGNQLEKDRNFRVGDIYDNGKYLGNVYDSTSGMTVEEANAMIAPHVFGDRAADKYKSANGDQDKLKQMILDQGAAEGANVEAYVTRLPYQKAVDGLLDDWSNTLGDEFAIAGASGLGGAVAGLPFGLIGAGVGFGLGALGGWMNADEARTQAAQALVSTGMMDQKLGTDAAIAHGTSQWGNLALSRLNVVSNLTGGIVDWASGNQGDNVSEIRQAAYEGNVGANIGLGVTGFVDGMLTAASKPGMLAYTALSGASAAGAAYNKAAHDGEWDETTGSFHRYENISQRMAAAGASAIDVSQMMLPFLLRRSNEIGMGGIKSETLEGMGTAGNTTRRTIMDRTFDVQNQGGKLVATGEDKLQSFVGWLAPSTITNRLTVRAAAQRDVIRQGRTSVTADDLYQAASRIENAAVPWKMMMINGFGEAGEEVLQTFLNAHAVGWAAEPQEYLQAGIAGFAMGAGMSVGSRFGTVMQDTLQLQRANTLAIMDNQVPFTKEQWKGMDRAEKLRLSTPTRSVERQIRTQIDNTMEDWSEVAVESTVALSVKEDAQRLLMKQQNINLPGGSLEDMAGILPFENVNLPSHHIYHSAATTLKRLQSRNLALQNMLQNPEGMEDIDLGQVKAAQEKLQELLDNYVTPAIQQYGETGDENALEAVNDLLRQYWNSADISEKQAVELIWSRSPNDNPGSFQMLLPQIDLDMTRNQADELSKISQSFEKLLSHDNDGDQIKHQARAFLTERGRRNLRLGLNAWASSLESDQPGQDTGGYLNVTKRSYEDVTLLRMGWTLAAPDKDERAIVESVFNQMYETLRLALGDAVSAETLRSFRNNLSMNPQGAKSELYRALASDLASLTRLGEEGNAGDPSVPNELRILPDTHMGLWIEDKLQQLLEGWRDGKASRNEQVALAPYEKSDTEMRAMPPRPGQAAPDLQTTRPTRAATLGQTGEMRSGGSDPYRSRGGWAYGPINSTSIDVEGYTDPDALRAELIQWYSVLTRLRPLSEIKTVKQGGSPVVRDARHDLENLAREFYPDDFKADPEVTLLRVANLPFWNITEGQLNSESWNMDKHTKFQGATVATALLRNAAERQATVQPTPAGQLDMTVVYSDVKPGEATQMLLGEIAPSNVLNKVDAEMLGSFTTLDSLVRHYTQLSSRAEREEWRRKKQSHYAYKDEDSVYRLLVDTVRLAVDTKLAHGDPATGRATGRLAKEDRTFHTKVVIKAFEDLYRVTNSLGLGDEVTPQTLMTKLENNTQVIENLLAMFSPEMRLKIISQSSIPGAPSVNVLPAWFFDLLMTKDAEKAAMIYFNAIFTLELDANENSQNPSNSWIALYLSLDDAGRQAFQDMRLTATDVRSFVDQVNRQLAWGRPPMMAWRTDTSLFDPSSTKAGWQWAAPSAERRQAIRDAGKYLASRASTIRDSIKLDRTNLMFAQNLLDAAKDPSKKASLKHQSSLTALGNRLQQAQTFNRAAMGTAGIREFVQLVHRGLDPDSAAKGKASPATAQFGDTDVRQNQTSFGSPLENIFDSITVVDAKALHPHMLTQPLRIQTSTGAIINWDPMSPEKWLEFFVADDGAYHGLLWDVLIPSVYEENQYGRATQQYLIPKDLQSIVESTVYQDMLLGEGTRTPDENNELFISFLNAMTPNNEVVRLVSKLVVARTTADDTRGELTENAYRRAINDTATLLRSVAGLAENDLEQAQQQLRFEAILQFLQDPEFADTSIFAQTQQLDTLVKVRAAELKRARVLYEQDMENDEASIGYLDAMQKYNQALGIMETSTAGELMFAAFRIPWGEPGELATRTMISQYLQTYGPALSTTMTGEDGEALARFSIAPDATDGLKLLDQADWDTLSRAVASHRALTTSGYKAAAFIATPQAKELAMFDPSFSYLGEAFLTNTLYSALQEFKKAAPAAALPTTTIETFRKTAEDTVLDRRRLGTWTPGIATQHINAERSLDAAGSGVQVSIGGSTSQWYIAASISSIRSYETPPEEFARKVVIKMEDLLDSRGNFHQKGFDGEPWAILENASVLADTLRLVVKDSQGNEISRTALDAALYQVPGTKDQTVQGITHKGLIEAVNQAYRKISGNDLDITIEMSMFHPADKPAEREWANNVHFDGTLGQADSESNLYDALLTGTMGIAQALQRFALESVKGSVAIFTQRFPRGFDIKDPEKLGDLIHDMAKTVMMTQIGKEYFMPNNVYRAVYRMIRDRLVVMGEDQDGNTVTLSSEQALGGGADALTNPRVVELSRESLETLRGSTTGSGHPRPLARAPRIGGEGETWTGSFSPEQLSRLPELGRRPESVAEVGASLRSSGLLSSERVTSYSYKTWTADDRIIQARPFESFDSLRVSIKDARRERKNEKRIRKINLELVRGLVSTLESTGQIDDATVSIFKESLGAARPDRNINRIGAANNLTDLLDILNGTSGRIFQLSPRNTGTAEEGAISSIRGSKGALVDQLSPVDDVVWVHLEAFPGGPKSREWQGAVRDELAMAREMGLTVVFTHPTDPSALLEAEQIMLQSSNYTRTSMNLPIYTPAEPTQMSQTLKARKASWGETVVRPTEGVELTALDDTGYVEADAEGSWFDPRSNLTGWRTAVSAGIVPTTLFAHYSSPGTTEAGARARVVYDQLLTPEGLEYLAEQALLGDGLETTSEALAEQISIIQPLIQKAARDLDELTGRPKRGTRLAKGDVIMVFREDTGATALFRWGYDSSKVDFEAQDQNGFRDVTRRGVFSSSSVRWVGTKEMEADKASIREGVIEEWKTDPSNFELRGVFSDALNMYGAKLIDAETGKKSRGVTIPENKRPTTPLLNNMFPGSWDSAIGWRKKGATRGMVLNARQGIYVFGWDASRTLANALGIVDGHPNSQATRWTIQEWADASESVRGRVTGTIRNLLEQQKRDTKPSDRLTDAEQAYDLMLSNSDSLAGRELMQQQRGISYAAAQAAARMEGVPLTEFDAEMAYLDAVATFLRVDGTYVSQVFGAPGLDQDQSIENPHSVEMPSALTEYIDANLTLRQYVQQDMNARMRHNRYDGGGNLVEGWYILDDWRVLQRNADGGRTTTVTLRAGRADPTGEDHVEQSASSTQTATSDNASNQQQMLGRVAGVNAGYGVRDERMDAILRDRGFSRYKMSLGRAYGARANGIQTMSLDEQQYRDKIRSIGTGLLVPLDREGWTDYRGELRKVEDGYNLVYKTLGIPGDGRHRSLVDTLIRTYYRAVHDPDRPGVDSLPIDAVLEALQDIVKQLNNGRWPHTTGRMPAIHANVVAVIANEGTWTPDNMSIPKDERLIRLVESALDNMWYSSTRIPPNSKLELDALRLSFEKYVTDGYWASSMFPDVIKKMIHGDGDRFVSTIDPIDQRDLDEGNPYREYNSVSIDDGDAIAREAIDSTMRLPSKSEANRRRRSDYEHGKDTGGLEQMTTAEIAKSGREYRSEVSATTEAWKNAHALRTIVPQLNPFLWVWNPVDTTFRRVPVAAANLLTGSSTGFFGRQIRNQVQAIAEASERIEGKLDPKSARDQRVQNWLTAFGIEKPYLDREANDYLPTLIKELQENQRFRSVIAQETRHRPDEAMFTGGDRLRQRLVDGASKLQDITHGMYRKHEAEMYITGILEHERMNNPNVDAFTVLRRLHGNPLYFMEQGPREAHEQAVRNIQNIKGAKQTLLGAVTDRVLVPMSKHHNAFVHGPANAILLLAKFRNFAYSSLTSMTGAQGLEAAGTILLQSLAFKKANRGETPKAPTDYIGQVLESADIADLFIRSGLSHTGLFMAALALNSLGLTGEDEEDRRRRRAEQLQGLGRLYDPRDIANSFLNRDTIWLEGLADSPLGALTAGFAIQTAEGQPERSPAQLHWTMNFFVAPAIGMAEFLQTGDFYDLARGFESALGQMPLINTNYFWDTWNTGATMYAAATDNVVDEPGSLNDGVSWLIKTVGVFEKALLESAFINELASYTDSVNRNPWGQVELDTDGTIKRDRDGLPILTEATDRVLDDNPASPTYGDYIDRRQTMSYEEGLVRSFTMNNQTAAFIATLVTGFQFDKGGSFMRQDQAVAQTTLLKTALSNEDAELLALSIWDEKNQKEVLTREGMERLFDSLHAGTVKAGDPAVQNVFITAEQRQEISDSIQTKLYIEGVEILGLSEEDATQRMWDIWNGPAGQPYVTPLSDVVWGRGKFAGENGIPWNQTTTYQQLNTTFAKGPDGKMWATGVARHTVLNMLGLPQSYLGSAQSMQGNLGVDEVLNSTDAAANINTGYRALTRRDESVFQPTEQDIIDMIKESSDRVIDSIKDLNSDMYRNKDNWGTGRGFRYGGGGRGGGGGGSRSYANNPLMPFLNGMRSPYADNIPQLYINNINVRRATLRRERFSSERGRLNQWQ